MSSRQQSSHASAASCRSFSSISAAALSPSRQEERSNNELTKSQGYDSSFDINFLGGQKYSTDDRSEDIDLLDSGGAGYSIIIASTPDNYLFIYLILWSYFESLRL